MLPLESVTGVGAPSPRARCIRRTIRHPDAFVRIVSDGYLKAMGIPLRAGRDLTEADNKSSKPVILINETLARTLWPGRDPIGQTVIADGDRQVAGVVGDVRHLALEQGSGCEMYLPIRQTGDYPSVDLVVRTTLPPAGLASAIRAALKKPVEPEPALGTSSGRFSS